MYRYEQKIRNNIYVYEIRSYWDKIKKQPRQYRKYLGKKDPITGNIIKPKHSKTFVTTKIYGHYYLLNEIAKNLKLIDTLKEIFPDIWHEIITLAYFQISEQAALYLCQPWLDVTYNIHKASLPSQKISDLLTNLGLQYDDIFKFGKQWIDLQNNNEYLFFDLTSFSSYSKNISYTEWGYNRDGENLPQINFGLIYGVNSHLPLFYNIYPGSINDSITIKNILKYCNNLNLKKICLILDKGFFSQHNLIELSENNSDFIISAPFSSNNIKNIALKHKDDIKTLNNAFKLNNKIYYGVKDKVSINDIEYNAYIYLDEKRKVDECQKFLSLLIDYENKLEELKINKKEILEDFLNNNFRGWKKYFNIVEKNNYYHVERNEANINDYFNRKGLIVLLSKKELKEYEVLKLYREKDNIEKCYDNIKNELDGKRMRIHNENTLKGKLFINFISVILYSEIDRIMKEKKMYKNYSVQSILQDLKKINYIKFENEEYLITEVTKKQREIFEAFNIALPT